MIYKGTIALCVYGGSWIYFIAREPGVRWIWSGCCKKML